MGLKDTTTGDTLCDADDPGRPRVDDLPGAGHPRGRSSRRPRATRRSSAPRSSGSPRRTRPSRSAPTRRPARRSSPAWASCTSTSSSTGMRREFKVEANVGKPQVAYRETIRQGGREGRVHAQEADRRLGPVRQRHHRHRASSDASRRRRRLRVRQRRHRRPHPARVHPVGRRGLPGGHGVRRRSPATRWSTSRSTLIDGAYHEVDSSELAFKIAGSMAFKEAAAPGRPGAAGADDGRRGHHARGLHGRRHRRPELPPWPDPGHGRARRRPRRQARSCRCRRCSATSATSAARPRVGRATACSSTRTPRFRANVAEEIIAKARGE